MDDIVVIQDRDHKWFWSFFAAGMTLVSHERHDTQEQAYRAGAKWREQILAFSADGGPEQRSGDA